MGKRGIPKQTSPVSTRLPKASVEDKCICFSFKSLDKNEYFNLDATCPNWASDLFDTMQIVSGIRRSEIIAGKYSGKQSPLRIHPHDDANPPCPVPPNIDLSELYQIRISLSKGGIHGIFIDNVFYVVWLDPQHNLYPNDRYGGLKVLKPPQTCCKDRDRIIEELTIKIESLEKDNQAYIQLLDELS